jgi:hypothetical protein
MVGHGAGVPRPLDELALGEGGEDDHRGDPLLGDALGRCDAVEDGHLHVQDHQVGTVLLGQLHGPGTVTGLPDDVVPLLDQHLREIHPDQRLVLGDDDAQGWPAHPLRLSGRCCVPTSGRGGPQSGTAASSATYGSTSIRPTRVSDNVCARRPGIPTAEEAVSNTVQCGFESHPGHRRVSGGTPARPR